jgi:hypothetical protein
MIADLVRLFANPTVLVILTGISWFLLKTIWVHYWIELFEKWL